MIRLACIIWLFCVLSAYSQPVPDGASSNVLVQIRERAKLFPAPVNANDAAQPAVSYVGITFNCTNEIQRSTDMQNWSTVFTTNGVTVYVSILKSGTNEFYRNKLTWDANPIGCIVSPTATTK